MEAIQRFIEGMDWQSLAQIWGQRAALSIIILLLAFLLHQAGRRAIDRYFALKGGGAPPEAEKKVHTLQPLFHQIWRYLVLAFALLLILSQAGVQLGPLLATAGIAGIAIGFGAQRLVRDLITGFLLLVEDQYSVGDYITVGKFTGIVEEVGLRVTRLRDFNGDLHIIPNGNIENVTNHARGAVRAWVEVKIPYEADLDRAIAVLEELAEELKEQYAEIVEGPTVLGVTEMSESGFVISIIARTAPLKHWQIERELRRAIKKRFDREKIDMAYPVRVLYHRGVSRAEGAGRGDGEQSGSKKS